MRHTRAWGLAAISAAAGAGWGTWGGVGCAGQPREPGPGSVFVEEQAPARDWVAPSARSGAQGVTPAAPGAPRASAAEGALRADVVSLHAGTTMSYVPWESSDAGPAAMRIERDPPATAPGAVWHVRRFITGAEGEETLESDYAYTLTPEGDVAVAEMVEHKDRVEVVFDPPLILMPASLERGETRTQPTRMTVHPLGDRSRTQNAGDAVNEIEYVDNERVRTPALASEDPAWPSRHIRSTLTANLGGPQIRNVTDTWLVDGVGIVSEQRHERTLLFGAPIRNNVERWALAPAGAEPRSGPAVPRLHPAGAAPAAGAAPPGSR